MKRRFFLTSLIVAGLIRPAMAETFPADGYMQEDKTYENAATYTNTGVYDGSVTATAEYTDNVYNIAAGMYLPAGAEVAETCTAGSFCPGKTDATYDESAPQGITACPTEYPNSAAGAGAQTQCYTACTVATANIAHATGVSGNNYYGGSSTCTPTSCDLGYHLESGELTIVPKNPLISVDYMLDGDKFAYLDASGSTSQFFEFGVLLTYDAGLTEPNTWAVHFDYGTVYGHASCNPDGNPGMEYYDDNLEALVTGEMTLEEFESGLAAIVGTVKAVRVTNALRDILLLVNEPEPDETAITEAEDKLNDTVYIDLFYRKSDANYSTDSTGNYCYCQMTGYTPTDGSFESVTSSSWLLLGSFSSDSSCSNNCVSICGSNLRRDYMIRIGVFGEGEFMETGGTCAANEIKINWTDAEEIGDAGMCKYGGDIKTPVKAVAKKGKTFKGWRFEKTN